MERSWEMPTPSTLALKTELKAQKAENPQEAEVVILQTNALGPRDRRGERACLHMYQLLRKKAMEVGVVRQLEKNIRSCCQMIQP